MATKASGPSAAPQSQTGAQTGSPAGSPIEAPPGAAPDAGAALRAIGVSKLYRIYAKPIHRVWDLFLPGGPRGREFWAVRDVYLDVPRGSTLGIIGENGAGKSTLLKMLSGVCAPTTGEVRVQGRVTSLLELGAGFHPEFSGRENIGLSCSILGLAPDEIREATPAIVAFSELGDFIDRPVKTYSSGMYVRLGFAVATCVHPDVLLIDEALSVGDEHFRGKCLNRLNQFRERGGTTVFVSHDLGAVRSMCQHVALMDRGEVVEQGSPERVASAYLKRVKARGNEQLSMAGRGSSEYPRWGSGELEVEEVELLDGEGAPTRVVRSRESVTVRLRWTARKDCARPVFGIGLYRSDGSYLTGTNHLWREHPIDLGPVQAGESGEARLALERLPLLEGQYYLTTFLYDHSRPAPTAVDHREHVLAFRVVDPVRHQHGMVHLDSRWTLERRRPGGERESQESAS